MNGADPQRVEPCASKPGACKNAGGIPARIGGRSGVRMNPPPGKSLLFPPDTNLSIRVVGRIPRTFSLPPVPECVTLPSLFS